MLFDNTTIRLLGSDNFPIEAKLQAAADLTTAAAANALRISVGEPLPLNRVADAPDPRRRGQPRACPDRHQLLEPRDSTDRLLICTECVPRRPHPLNDAPCDRAGSRLKGRVMAWPVHAPSQLGTPGTTRIGEHRPEHGAVTARGRRSSAAGPHRGPCRPPTDDRGPGRTRIRALLGLPEGTQPAGICAERVVVRRGCASLSPSSGG